MHIIFLGLGMGSTKFPCPAFIKESTHKLNGKCARERAQRTTRDKTGIE